MTKTHELWVSDTPDEALRKAKITLKKLGELTAVVPNQYIVGHVAFGLTKTTVRVTWQPEDREDTILAGPNAIPRKQPGTLFIMEVEAPEGGLTAVSSAIDRFEDAYRHAEQPDYQPDRVGILPMTMIGIGIVILLLIALLAKRTKIFKPELAKPKTTMVVPGIPMASPARLIG